MRLKEKRLKSSRLYLVLDRGSLKFGSPDIIAGKALGGGVDVIQLRDKLSCDKEIVEYGRRLREITSRKKALFIVNDRTDICTILDADGVHLGQDDAPLKRARSILGEDKIIGVSCHSLGEAMRAEAEGADYVAVGPIFKSPTKPRLKPRGLRLLEEVNRKARVPVVAIGGINEANVGDVVGRGADMVAVVSALLARRDVRNGAIALRKKIG